jgi:hypothetical protein
MKPKVDQNAYRAAMVQQGRVKVEDFPIGNRAARRLAKSRKAKKSAPALPVLGVDK